MKNAIMVVMILLMATLLALSSNVLGDSKEVDLGGNLCSASGPDRDFRMCTANCTNNTENCTMYEECMEDCWLDLMNKLALLVYGDD